MGKKSSRTEGWFSLMPCEKVVAPYSLVYSKRTMIPRVSLVFCLLPRHVYFPLQGSKKAISLLHLEIILLVFYKCVCSHLM